MKCNNFRQRAISIAEANKILVLLKKCGVKVIYIDKTSSYKEAKLKYNNYSDYALLVENDSTCWLETKYYEPQYKATRYIINLNGELETGVKGLQCFNKLQQYCYRSKNAKNYHWKDLDDLYDKNTGRYNCSAGPIIGYNSKYENTELKNIYEYDINSAYSSIMLKGIPDVNNPIFNSKIGDNQVGFLLDNECTMITKKGCMGDVVFNIIQLNNTQKKYIEKLYLTKETTTDKKEHDKIKVVLNAGIGYYQRWNPFIRAYIVHSCNEVIKSLLDNNSVLWNTDAIFSLKKRPELNIGPNIGQFKEIAIDRFAYKGNNYQVNYDLPKYRGIPKEWFTKNWNILTDSLPKKCNRYIIDSNELKIVINKEYYEKEIN